jgi:hypothetical protein
MSGTKRRVRRGFLDGDLEPQMARIARIFKRETRERSARKAAKMEVLLFAFQKFRSCSRMPVEGAQGERCERNPVRRFHPDGLGIDSAMPSSAAPA